MDSEPRAAPESVYSVASDHWTFVLFAIVSVICHVVFFLAIALVPDMKPQRRIARAAINVSMVSLPAAKPGPMASEPATQEPSAPEPKPEAVPAPPPKKVVKEKAVTIQKPSEPEPPPPEPKAKISVKPQKKKKTVPKKEYKPKKSLKKKTFKRKKVVKKALKDIEKRVDEDRPQPVSDAIARLRKQVGKDSALDRIKRKVEQQTSSGRTATGGGAFGVGPKALEMIDIYRAEVPFHIQNNWAFSKQLAGGVSQLEAVLVIKILPSGEIADIWFEKKSGNPFLDDSAYKAVVKSNPLPPLPSGYPRPYYNLGLIFTPAGVM